MTKTNRFIKVPLWLLEWEWADNAEYILAFLLLVKSVNKVENKWHGITVERGSIISSISGIAQICKLSEQKTRTFLKRCSESNLIIKESTSTYTKVTILNFDEFQGYVSTKNNQHGKNEVFSKKSEKINTVEFEKSTSNQHGATSSISENLKGDIFGANKVTTRLATNEQQTNNKRATTTKEYKKIKEYKEGGEEYACARAREEAPTPPTLEEIRIFCSERNSSVNPARFYNYNAVRNWKGVTDWKSKIEEWEGNEYASEDKAKTDKLNAYISGAASNNSFSDIDLDMFDETRRICEV